MLAMKSITNNTIATKVGDESSTLIATYVAWNIHGIVGNEIFK